MKQRIIQEYKSLFSGFDTFIVIGYTGTGANDMTGVRHRLRDTSVRMTIIKNSLAKRALDEAGLKRLMEVIDGPSALCFGADDVVALAKAVSGCVKEAGALEIKGGCQGQRIIPIQDIRRLAAIPSREVLYTQVACLLASPLTRLARTMHEMLARTARLFAALAEQKQETEGK
jgi:large subunit ribosomal protein L10